jgi:hypothetical protein
MTKRWTTLLGGCAALALLCCVPMATRAQEPETDAPPKPAGSALPPLATTDDTPTPDTVFPDGRPLTGVQSPTLGKIESPHSYWIPGFQYSNTIQNNLPGSTNAGWSVTNFVAANVSLLESWRSSQLSLNYSGGGSFSTDSAQGSGTFQQLGVSQLFQWSRWQLQFFDQMSYLPESQFGFGAGTGLGLPGGGVPLSPPQTGVSGNGQSLFSAAGPRFNNVFTTQAIYQISPRASINVSGTDGILRFVDPGNVDSNNIGASVGYNYQLSKTDTIGVVYHFSRYSYVGNPQSINDNSFNFAYGKKITGRLALQVFGGPDITDFKVAIGNQSRQVTGSGGANLSYAINRGVLSAGYTHGVTGGSGVFAGSETDEVQANISHQFGRVWQAQANIGFAKNRALANSAIGGNYDSVFVGGGVSRPFGPNMSFALSYSARIQNTGGTGTACTGATCNVNYTQNQISMSFQWHTRPLVLR